VRSAPAILLAGTTGRKGSIGREFNPLRISGTSVADATRCTWSSHRERKDRGAMPPSTVSVPEHRHSEARSAVNVSPWTVRTPALPSTARRRTASEPGGDATQFARGRRSAKPHPRVVDLDEGLTTATGDGPDASTASPGRTVQQLEVTTAPVAIAIAQPGFHQKLTLVPAPAPVAVGSLDLPALNSTSPIWSFPRSSGSRSSARSTSCSR